MDLSLLINVEWLVTAVVSVYYRMLQLGSLRTYLLPSLMEVAHQYVLRPTFLPKTGSVIIF